MNLSLPSITLLFLIASCSQLKKPGAQSPSETTNKRNPASSEKIISKLDPSGVPLGSRQSEKVNTNGGVSYLRPKSPYPDLENEVSTFSEEELDYEAQILPDQNNVKIISPPGSP